MSYFSIEHAEIHIRILIICLVNQMKSSIFVRSFLRCKIMQILYKHVIVNMLEVDTFSNISKDKLQIGVFKLNYPQNLDS